MQTVSGPVISTDLSERFRQARDVLVLTGAGVSAESGVPTFRGGGDSAEHERHRQQRRGHQTDSCTKGMDVAHAASFKGR